MLLARDPPFHHRPTLTMTYTHAITGNLPRKTLWLLGDCKQIIYVPVHVRKRTCMSVCMYPVCYAVVSVQVTN